MELKIYYCERISWGQQRQKTGDRMTTALVLVGLPAGKDYRSILRSRNLQEYKSQIRSKMHINVRCNETGMLNKENGACLAIMISLSPNLLVFGAKEVETFTALKNKPTNIFIEEYNKYIQQLQVYYIQ
jgi:hypothetical protein